MKFETLGLSHDLLKHITKLGFEEPTEIQELSIPHILKGKDIIGESATGSGKTLAFGTGIVEKTDSRKKRLITIPIGIKNQELHKEILMNYSNF